MHHLRVACFFATCSLACELGLLVTMARKEAAVFLLDRWSALDLTALSLSAMLWLWGQTAPQGLFEAASALLALRFALQPWRTARPAGATSSSASLAVAGAGVSVRSLRPTQQSGGIAFDTDLGFDNTSCCSSSELRAERTLEAKQDSGFESSSCCSISELTAERALEAKQANEFGFDGADLDRSFEFDDIDCGWVCVHCGTLNVGEDRGACDYCEASPTHGDDI
jgi:hypothetical protein